MRVCWEEGEGEGSRYGERDRSVELTRRDWTTDGGMRDGRGTACHAVNKYSKGSSSIGIFGADRDRVEQATAPPDGGFCARSREASSALRV